MTGEGDELPNVLCMCDRSVPPRSRGVFSFGGLGDKVEPKWDIGSRLEVKWMLLIFGVLEVGESIGDAGRDCSVMFVIIIDGEVLPDTEKGIKGWGEMSGLGEHWVAMGVRAPSENEPGRDSYS